MSRWSNTYREECRRAAVCICIVPSGLCPQCGSWIEKSHMFCPLCRAPLVRITTTRHYAGAIVAVGIILITLVALVLLAIQRFVH